MARYFERDARPARTRAKRPRQKTIGPKGRGQWLCRVIFKREGWTEKIKKFGRESDALRFARIIQSEQPWKHFRYPADPSDEHQCRADSCLCKEAGPGKQRTLERFYYNLRAQWPPLEYCRLERRWMQPWEPLDDPWWRPELDRRVIVDPSRMLPARSNFRFKDDEPVGPDSFGGENYEAYDIPF